MSDPYTTDNSTETVVASVTNVNSQNAISVKLNNKQINFDFNSSTGVVTINNVSLANGNNTVVVSATNSAGSDSDDVVIIYDTMDKPVVNITKPGTNPYTSPADEASIVATVKNVDSKSDIKFTVNGKTSTAFSFVPQLDRFTATVDLSNGNNTVVIVATNAAGSDSDDVLIKYSKPMGGGGAVFDPTDKKPPVVKITKPGTNPYTSPTDEASVVATIKNVDSKSNVKFTVNGKTSTDFSFIPQIDRFTATVDLSNGNNTLVITATNSAGSSSDDVIVKYNKPSLGGKPGAVIPVKTPPTVNITKPGSNPYTSTKEEVTVEAKVNNVDSKSNIKVTLNSKQINGFTFIRQLNLVKVNLDLAEGNNNVVVTATNQDGSDSDDIRIKYNKPLGGTRPGAVITPSTTKKAPTVKITKPGTNPYTSPTDKASIIATITDVDSKNNVALRVNGQRLTSFDYIPQLGRFSATINLKNGNNTVEIIATNGGGTGRDDILIKYTSEQSSNIGSVFTRPGSKSNTSGSKTTPSSTGSKDTGSGRTGGLGKGKNSGNKAPASISGKPVVEVVFPVRLKDRTVRTATADIDVNVKGVAGKSNIQVIVNGKQTPFQYNTRTGQVKSRVNLKRGANKIEVKATNKKGKTEEAINMMRL